MSQLNIRGSKQSNINKILVVGHPLSGYESVAELLQHSGMGVVKPSKREQMSPHEVCQALLKAHSNQLNDDSVGIEQLTISPVWNGLTLDLMMANIDQSMLCWADSEAISLLDYWKSLDPQMAFVLVYNSPDDFIAQAFSETEELSAELLQKQLDIWNAYNQALLKFFYHNRERTLLVHAQQIRANSGEYLRQVKNQIGVPLLSDVEHTARISEITILNNKSLNDTTTFYHYMAQDLLQEYPDVLQLYDELQASANLPSAQGIDKISTRDAWLDAVREKKLFRQNLESAEKEKKTLEKDLRKVMEEKEGLAQSRQKLSEALKQELVRSKSERESLLSQKDELTQKVATLHQIQEEKIRLESELKNTTSSKEEYAQESELLLAQLHLVQEELEKHYLQKEQQAAELSQQIAELARAGAEKEQQAAELSQQIAELARAGEEKEQQATELSQQIAELVRVDADKENRVNQLEESAHRLQHELMLMHQEAEALNISRERIQKQLSYRLGKVMVENSRSILGWVKMPWAMSRAYRDYKQSRRNEQ